MTSSMDLMHKQKHPSLVSEKIKGDCWTFLLIVKSAMSNVCVQNLRIPGYLTEIEPEALIDEEGYTQSTYNTFSPSLLIYNEMLYVFYLYLIFLLLCQYPCLSQ